MKGQLSFDDAGPLTWTTRALTAEESDSLTPPQLQGTISAARFMLTVKCADGLTLFRTIPYECDAEVFVEQWAKPLIVRLRERGRPEGGGVFCA